MCYKEHMFFKSCLLIISNKFFYTNCFSKICAATSRICASLKSSVSQWLRITGPADNAEMAASLWCSCTL